MKVALVGLGYWGEKVLRNLVALMGPDHLLAVDERGDRRDAVRGAYPGVACAATVDAALEDDEVQAVVLATPAATHAPLGRRVLQARRHLLVEKPLATSVPDADELVRLAADRSLKLMVGHTFLFSPRVDVLTGAVKSGRVGNVHYVTTSRLNLGLYQDDINVIWDLAPHDFSIVFHVLQEFPVMVQTMARSSRRGGVPDVAFMHLAFPSGAIASTTVSWRAPRKVRNTVVVGDEGMIVYDDTQPDEPIKLYDRGVVGLESSSFGEHQLTYRFGDTVSPHVAAVEPLSVQLRHFLSCVEDGGDCISDGTFGLEVVKALECADRSWQLGGIPVGIGAAAVKRTA
ncbi:MAG TPA: Gfo/Idh/MocA family oxidoreductase [Acidimicrobiales bacterium]|nr:Gfo/Idh/MocA family oxidoreductase [Acidimicrobiales bacterium]